MSEEMNLHAISLLRNKIERQTDMIEVLAAQDIKIDKEIKSLRQDVTTLEQLVKELMEDQDHRHNFQGHFNKDIDKRLRELEQKP